MSMVHPIYNSGRSAFVKGQRYLSLILYPVLKRTFPVPRLVIAVENSYVDVEIGSHARRKRGYLAFTVRRLVNRCTMTIYGSRTVPDVRSICRA